MLTKSAMLTLLLIFHLNAGFAQLDIIQRSRANCVKIFSPSAKVSGTGFFLNDEQIVTCFHVIAAIEQKDTTLSWQVYQDLTVVFYNNDTLRAFCITPPTKDDLSPLAFDFAVLQLRSKPTFKVDPNRITVDAKGIAVGDEAIFSGYPLQTPSMVTHKGMISGFSKDTNIICVQAAINKGNSGGALLDSQGQVIGILSMREGGVTQALMQLSKEIEATQRHGSIGLMGIDPLKSLREIIQVLDTYISTGIGYAINIKHLREYIARHSRQ
jgi:S1-C subfamily serine protease